MKEQAIQKINKIGKISSIITLVAKILVGIGMAVTLIGTIICFMIPESMLKFQVDGTMTIQMDYSVLGITMSEQEMEDVQTELEQSIISDDANDVLANVEVSEDKFIITDEIESFDFSLRDASWLAVLGLAVMVMTFVTLMFVGSLCKAFRDCQSPFEETVIKKMQNLAISLIPWVVISTVAKSISDSLMNHKLSITFTVDLGVMLIVLVVLVLVYIFKYGAVLQQESDETL